MFGLMFVTSLPLSVRVSDDNTQSNLFSYHPSNFFFPPPSVINEDLSSKLLDLFTTEITVIVLSTVLRPNVYCMSTV